MGALGISKKNQLSKLLNISAQTLKNREDRGMSGLNDIELLCNLKGINKEWVFTGKENIPVNYVHQNTEYRDHEKSLDPITAKITAMLAGMSVEQRRDILKYTEEKKQLAELKAEKKKKVV